MKAANQREKTPSRVVIELNFILKALAQDIGAFVVHAAARHIDGLNLRRGGIADRVVIALAQHEIVFNDFSKRRHGKMHLAQRGAAVAPDIEHQAALYIGQVKLKRPLAGAIGLEKVFLQQVIDRDFTLVLYISGRRRKGALVKLDLDDSIDLLVVAVLSHKPLGRMRGLRFLCGLLTAPGLCVTPNAFTIADESPNEVGPREMNGRGVSIMRLSILGRGTIVAAATALASPAALSAQDQPALPDIAQALMQAAYDSEDAAEIAAVARAVKAVFPNYAAAIEAQASAKLTELARIEQAEAEIAAASKGAVEKDVEPQEVALEVPPPPPPPPGIFALRPWDGKINASGLLSDGNSENVAAGVKVEAVRKSGSLVHNIKGFFDLGRSRGKTNQKRWGASYQLDFDLGDATYAYGRLSYEENEFSGFDYRLFAGAGLGHFYFDTETFVWKVEGGPGFRYSPIDATREIEQQVALYASSEIDWQIRDGVELEQDVNVTWTTPTTTFETVTALTTQLTDSISTGLSFEYRYETDPPEGRENFDAIARASLIYGF